MMVLPFIFILAFIGYHTSLFSYCVYIFNSNKFPVVAGIVCGIINFAFWYIYVFHISVEYEGLAMLVYLLMLLVETKVIFKRELVNTIFVSISFCINLFAKRIILLALFSLDDNTFMISSLNGTEHLILAAIISFAMSITTINFARKNIPRLSLDMIQADKKNISFLSVACSILFITLLIFLLTFNVNIKSNELLNQYIVLGVFVIIAFAVFIVFAHKLAELKISTETYKKISKENLEEKIVLMKLEKEAILDDLTNIYTRSYADTIIDKYITEKKSFFIGFVDLDGLKLVNDYYGHEEGDFYIKTAVNVLKEYFREDIICRYGGDEIVIIGEYKREEDITLKLVRCHNSILNISKIYKKNYTTSISYGVVFKNSNEIISATELLAIADSRMYELKKSQKKHRKVIEVK